MLNCVKNNETTSSIVVNSTNNFHPAQEEPITILKIIDYLH